MEALRDVENVNKMHDDHFIMAAYKKKVQVMSREGKDKKNIKRERTAP
jgi:hypothetical protein